MRSTLCNPVIENGSESLFIGIIFMTPEEAEETMQDTLVVYDDDKKVMGTLAVEQKGVTEGIVKYLVGVLDSLVTRARR